MGLVIVATILALFAAAALLFAFVALRRANRPRPALPLNCGDCVFMLPRARVYRRETIEDDDGLIHYLCQQRWTEVTPASPRCELGRSKTLTAPPR
ncbi:MAG TPA: hypothetical protein VGT60_03795 [Candidatus Limnocylindria bacterium]|nr:hypothetical protein [Candidatus Limnocylindria bacterium]